jgi:hypothetical protein
MLSRDLDRPLLLDRPGTTLLSARLAAAFFPGLPRVLAVICHLNSLTLMRPTLNPYW